MLRRRGFRSSGRAFVEAAHSQRLPVRFDGTCNGDFMPLGRTPAQRAASALAHEIDRRPG